jgi:DNA invertase Pin-like site-specific DNA recombinase
VVSNILKVALYARVSTKQHGQDVETQLIPLRAEVQRRGWHLFDTYEDTGWSGSKERRPQLDRLMADARKHAFDVVMVARFDRFARSTKHLISALEEFQHLGVDFVSMNEAIDTSTPVGELLFTLIAAIAKFERELIRERTRMGVERARLQGKKLGRPTVLVDRIRLCERIASGESIARVAKTCGISRDTVRRIVASSRCAGEKAGAQTVESLQRAAP